MIFIRIMQQLSPEQLAEAREKYTDEDIDRFIDRAKRLASKAVLHTLIELVKYTGGKTSSDTNPTHVKSLIKKINKRKPYDYSESVVVEFNEIKQKLHMSLTLAPADYDSTVDIPHESYTQEICTWRSFLVTTAQTYWKYFIISFPELHTELKKFIPEWTGELTIASNGTSLYFTEECPFRVSVFCRYVDESTNTVYWKKQQKK